MSTLATQSKLDAFTTAYIECALWASSDGNGESFEDCYISDIDESSLRAIISVCQDFQESNTELLTKWYEHGETPERAGHDFWLTRNRHGAGFWDRYNDALPEGKLGRQLTDNAHSYGECDVYVGDDEKLYFS